MRAGSNQSLSWRAKRGAIDVRLIRGETSTAGVQSKNRMVIHKPLDLPSEVVRGFVEAMNDYFAETKKHKRDAIAAHQLSVQAALHLRR